MEAGSESGITLGGPSIRDSLRSEKVEKYMIGYTPFLGQVRLVRPGGYRNALSGLSLGQVTLTEDQRMSYVRQLDNLMTRHNNVFMFEQRSDFGSLIGENLPTWEERKTTALSVESIVFDAWRRLSGESVEDYYWTDEENDATLKFSRAVLDLEKLKEDAEARAAATTGSARPAPLPSPAPSMPTIRPTVPSAAPGRPSVTIPAGHPTPPREPTILGVPRTVALITGGILATGLVVFLVTQ